MKVVWGFSFVLFLKSSADASIYRATGQRGGSNADDYCAITPLIQLGFIALSLSFLKNRVIAGL
jgi:hypothetical protein